MIAHLKNGVRFFRFSLFKGFTDLVHGVFGRHGGYSPVPYDSLNVGLNGGDAPDRVQLNRCRVADCMGANRPLVFARQVHGTDVASLKRKDTISDRVKIPPDITADAMVTDIPGMPLGIQLADCQAILMYDPLNRVVANVHSGWRGSIQNIVGKTIERMQSDFSCRPSSIRAAVSPSLGPCCGEFKNYQTEIPEKFWCYRDDRERFNFWALTRDQLTEAGVLLEHIELSGICTRCNGHLFYSYRQTPETGRFAAVIGLIND
ncbi:MAG: peptidoglycan editing factor PgeF [Desulfobacterales bacterium]|nr:peptidoglycan editing factor PgeF [Desulfobacterales bacterium]